jgi:hypothetical protein
MSKTAVLLAFLRDSLSSWAEEHHLQFAKLPRLPALRRLAPRGSHI